MQDEEMDNMDEIIREASESHHPVYDDKAWEKMEALLDKHLPLQKDRRRPAIFFLLLFLLFITGTVFFAMLFQPAYKKESIPEQNIQAGISKQKPPANNPIAPNNPIAGTNILVQAQKTRKNISVQFLPGRGERDTGKNFEKTLPVRHFANGRKHISTSAGVALNDSANESGIAIKSAKILIKDDEQVAGKTGASLPYLFTVPLKAQPVSKSIQIVQIDSSGITAIKEKVLPAPSPTKSLPKPAIKKGFANNFAVNISAGPDRSFVAVGDASKTRINYGIGLGYTFANRITLRSGFYIAKKTYSAGPADYHPPSWYWTYNSDIKRINADCNVYEIPLSASYNFKKSKNHSWMAGVGFSTFLMKRETYNYLYKDAWGQTRNKSWTLLNGSEHYFSVFTISGGYQYQFSQKFSILAEPYLKLPLHGIGFGKIKLNSGGLLFTASIKPFIKSK